MSRQQRQDLDTKLHSAPHPPAPASIEQARQEFADFMGTFPVPTDVRRTDTRIADRPAVLVEAHDGARPGTILYFHGGSFVVGSPDTAMVLTANLVRRTGIKAVSVDYRLAPEHPFPAAVEDGVAAFRSLLDGGADPASIAFAGDSAGGGLTVMTALAARDAGLPMPAAIAAFSPLFDLTRSGATMTTKVGIDPFFTEADFAGTGEQYLGGQDPRQPLLAPAVLADLTGLPPILLQVGTNELLLDDSVRLAERARDAEVDVILDVIAGVPHVFPSFVGAIDEAAQAFDRAALFLRQQVVDRAA